MTDVLEPSARTLAAFLSGECSAAEAADVLRWAQSTPERAAQLERLRATWRASERPGANGIGSWDSDAIWQAISSRLDDEPQRAPRLVAAARTGRRSPFAVTRRRQFGVWATAACAALIIAVFATQRAGSEGDRPPVALSDTGRVYRTHRGQRASGTLPDGSAFQLGPLSVLRVPTGYGGTARVVELEGDGYFNVTHDERRPFAVRTARTTIRDLGTRFIVRARPTEQRVEVAVAEGEVSIEPLNQQGTSDARAPSNEPRRLMVTAGQVALVDERGLARLLRRASVASRFAWTRGELAFDHVLVPDVLAELSRWYGDVFVLADRSLADVRLTTVLRGDTLLEALVVLETALDVDAHVHRDTVTLTRHRDDKR